jgi:hypothetical protein
MAEAFIPPQPLSFRRGGMNQIEHQIENDDKKDTLQDTEWKAASKFLNTLHIGHTQDIYYPIK